LKTRETVLEVAGSPKNHGVAATAEFVGDLQVGWLVVAAKLQDQATTEDQSLRRGMSPREGFQPFAFFTGQDNRRSKGVWHDRHPCRETGISVE